jgi:hypothetical protein
MSSKNISYFEKTNLLAYMISACRVDHHAWFFLCKDSEDQMTAKVAGQGAGGCPQFVCFWICYWLYLLYYWCNFFLNMLLITPAMLLIQLHLQKPEQIMNILQYFKPSFFSQNCIRYGQSELPTNQRAEWWLCWFLLKGIVSILLLARSLFAEHNMLWVTFEI